MNSSPRRNVVNPRSTRSTLNCARRTIPSASQRSTMPSQAYACDQSGRSLRTWIGLPGASIPAKPAEPAEPAAGSDVRLLRDQRLECCLVEDRRTELLRLGQFRACLLPGDQVACFLGHRVAQRATHVFDPLLDLRPAVAFEPASDHDRQSSKWSTARYCLFSHVDARGDELVDDPQIVW